MSQERPRPRRMHELVTQLEAERDAVIAEAERVAATITEELANVRAALRVLLMQSTIVRAENEQLRGQQQEDDRVLATYRNEIRALITRDNDNRARITELEKQVGDLSTAGYNVCHELDLDPTEDGWADDATDKIRELKADNHQLSDNLGAALRGDQL